MAHVDVMDNRRPEPFMGAGGRSGREVGIPVDAHLMIEDPDRWAPAYAGLLGDFPGGPLTPTRLAVNSLRLIEGRSGVGETCDGYCAPFVDILSEFDMILVMTVEPSSEEPVLH